MGTNGVMLGICVDPSLHGPCRVPVPKAVLFYGAPGSGKTMLAHAIAHESGAHLFDISPCLTDGKYPGRAATMMMHMVSPFSASPGAVRGIARGEAQG